MIRICMEDLPESTFWFRANPASNSIGNLLLHLSGNMTQYVVSGLGGAADLRDRDSEFSREPEETVDAVWSRFLNTVERSKHVLTEVDEENLLRIRTVQGFEMSGLGMALHAVEHLSYHTGQIALIVKSIHGEDLGFYQGIDLNKHNE